MSMKKVSSEEAKAVLSQVGPTLRALTTKVASLQEEVTYYKKRDRCEKLASIMEEKQLDPDTNFQEKVAALMAKQNLDVVEEALSMSAPQIKLAEVTDNPGNPSDATSAFEIGIMEGVGR